ncbi:MAG: CHAD domain-containing protein [Ilumatobacter sp.]
MNYRIDPDRDLLAEVRRIAAEQATKAQRVLMNVDEADFVDAVHDARKRCKKVRGLAHLVRPSLGDQYKATNHAFRDAARALSPYRDAHALLDTFDRLVVAEARRLPDAGFGAARDELAARSRDSTAAFDQSLEAVEQALGFLRDGVDIVDSWSLEPGGWRAIGGGLRKSYARGVDALAIASNDGTNVDFHELRKRAKHTRYHGRLLEQTAPSILRPRAVKLDDLSDSLGDAHDLAVLAEQMRSEPDAFGGGPVVDTVVTFIDGRRSDLERRSLVLAHRLYAESPKCFTRRLGEYWACHRRWGDELEAGGIDDIVADSTTDDFDDLTVVELRVVAREADLAGRSSMARGDLVAALRASSVGWSGG